MRKGGKPSGKSRTVFSELSSQLTEEHTWCFGLWYSPTRFKPDFVFSVSMFPILTLCSCVHDVLGSLLSKHHWRPLCCTHYWNHHPVAGATWQQAVSFWQRNEKKPPRWLRGGAKANWAKWMLFWEICRPDVEYVEPVDIIPWCFVHIYPANKRSGGNNFRPRSCNLFKALQVKINTFDPGILQPMGSWISMRYGK